MPITGDYVASSWKMSRDQVAGYEASGGRTHRTIVGKPVVIVTYRGRTTGKVRKTPVMRVEHDGVYAIVASLGGAAHNPQWYASIVADPHVMLQDGPEPADYVAREVHGDEKALWWERAVAAFPPYAGYRKKTTREIPVLVLEPVTGA
ncbi:nitroreductase family deazaflavin-dependent oxidoreductase [Mumia zhuanghuii]|uniref:Nitroreductase family deazaflavin-dependent oxidoreductase n=1 Tax=Mumia zhuanghuii TaxID=2585211 RepID=A0A5C4MMN2_9ACTN|nr:nitroreductase family deazaflavin-dependent oxidoreductase [Mumia zhuanghuii]TNC46823.1 nitroreductase family deazaflavin-dependent oxidoreductase [Mumia zhuanghuii]TNC47129.1 nitroreductase family deazaflavin-dependent oxidoreductase [Mumia zhuanghuii]